jgi:hypothetical protein
MYVIAQKKQLGSGAIADGETDAKTRVLTALKESLRVDRWGREGRSQGWDKMYF